MVRAQGQLLQMHFCTCIPGMKNFVEDITAMLGFSPSWYFKICWWFVSTHDMLLSTHTVDPLSDFACLHGGKCLESRKATASARRLVFQFILIFTFIGYEQSSYGKVTLSGNAEIFGWVISTLSLLCVPSFALYQVIRNRKRVKPDNFSLCIPITWIWVSALANPLHSHTRVLPRRTEGRPDQRTEHG